MKKDSFAIPLDVRAFAQAAASRTAQDTLRKYERLMAETQEEGGDAVVSWSAQGEMRPVPGEESEIWLHLQADATVAATCQRCLQPVEIPLVVDRSFRFVNDEATAALLDEEAEEEVLAIDPQFDLAALIEDELLMEMPLVPRHEVCPTEVKLEAVDEDFDAALAEKPKPFAALAKLKGGKPH
jgi:uncharacterized protein